MVIVKKLLSLFLSFALLFSMTVFCVSPVTFADTKRVGYISKTNVHIRQDASTSSSSIKTVSKLHVNISEQKNDISNTINPATNQVYVWYKVSLLSAENIVGYVREDLIQVFDVVLDAGFTSQLSAFPVSYHNSLILLHALYPNWTFTPDIVPTTFNDTVSSYDNLFYKLVNTNYNSLRSMRKGCYNWQTNQFVETDSGGWYGASRELIAYYIDPRNFLNDNDIYQYLQQTYNSTTQNIDGVKSIISGSFIDKTVNVQGDAYYGKHYAEVIIAAAQSSGVNPYILASTILQEQGINGSSLSSGLTYNNTAVYNFFNYGATGNTQTEVINNALNYAYNSQWFTPSAAIIGGAAKYGSGYINIGQDTYFYKNYNILNPDRLNHIYATNVADSLNSSQFLRTIYNDQKNLQLNFRIPVFSDLPEQISQYPPKNDSYNNYYFSDIQVDGLTPSFDRYTYEYSLSVDTNTTVYLSLPSGATYYGSTNVSLSPGLNEVKFAVIAQTGFSNVYTINVDASKVCSLSLSVSDNTSQTPTNIVLGDTNGDKKVTTSDLANIRLHLLTLIRLKGNNLISADTNKDGKITTSDLANIKLHLLKLITLKY